MRRHCVLLVALTCVTLSATVTGATFKVPSNPFQGSTALTTPGRQVVGNEPFIDFISEVDMFLIPPALLNAQPISFISDEAGNIPPSGVNVVALQTLDNDGNPATAFNAGSAANLIADQITEAGPGFFIYFNSGLNLPRLVYSTDLSDNTADLKIIFRLTNFEGLPEGMASFGNFNFIETPEPSSFQLMAAGCAVWAIGLTLWRRRHPAPR